MKRRSKRTSPRRAATTHSLTLETINSIFLSISSSFRALVLVCLRDFGLREDAEGVERTRRETREAKVRLRERREVVDCGRAARRPSQPRVKQREVRTTHVRRPLPQIIPTKRKVRRRMTQHAHQQLPRSFPLLLPPNILTLTTSQLPPIQLARDSDDSDDGRQIRVYSRVGVRRGGSEEGGR